MTESGSWEIIIDLSSLPADIQLPTYHALIQWCSTHSIPVAESMLHDTEGHVPLDAAPHLLQIYPDTETTAHNYMQRWQLQFPTMSMQLRFLPYASWADVWDDQLTYFETPRFIVGDLRTAPDSPKTPIHITPSTAFGDGRHITTRVILRLLDRLWQVQPPHSVLDVGCGNGVLAIAAYQCGARIVTATDIVDEAITATRAHAQLNHVVLDVRHEAEPYDGRTFQYVIANIPAAGLVPLMPSLHRCLAPQGQLVVAGFFMGDLPWVEESARQQGLTRRDSYMENEWPALVFDCPPESF